VWQFAYPGFATAARRARINLVVHPFRPFAPNVLDGSDLNRLSAHERVVWGKTLAISVVSFQVLLAVDAAHRGWFPVMPVQLPPTEMKAVSAAAGPHESLELCVCSVLGYSSPASLEVSMLNALPEEDEKEFPHYFLVCVYSVTNPTCRKYDETSITPVSSDGRWRIVVFGISNSDPKRVMRQLAVLSLSGSDRDAATYVRVATKPPASFLDAAGSLTTVLPAHEAKSPPVSSIKRGFGEGGRVRGGEQRGGEQQVMEVKQVLGHLTEVVHRPTNLAMPCASRGTSPPPPRQRPHRAQILPLPRYLSPTRLSGWFSYFLRFRRLCLLRLPPTPKPILEAPRIENRWTLCSVHFI
jgi:hypothetical protein